MSKFLKSTAIVALTLSTAPALADGFGLGREAHPEEIAAWNLDIMPDGTGLPVGSGSVEDGEMIFSENCAVCHGEFAEGAGNWPKLAGGDGTLADRDPLKTVGSYWPYLSTVFDYVRRSMPFGAAQTLSDDDVYAMTAYILYSNYLVEDDFVLTNENFLEVEMPNADGFIVDDRPETEYTVFTEENACFEDCKDSVEITMRATVLDVTPEETAADAAMQEAAEAEEVDVAEVETTEEAAEEVAEASMEMPAFTEDQIAAGEKVFRKCKACHKVGDDARNGTGPVLNAVIGAPVAHIEDFRYSSAFQDAADGGMVWTMENLTEYLRKPRDFMPGTRMSFAGLRDDEDITDVIAYLSQFQ